MASRAQLWVIAYDIADDRRRRRVATLLESRAARVQESLFEERMTKHAANRLFAELKALCGAGDSLRLYPITDTAVRDAHCHGGPAIAAACRYWLV
jgi:CRISPR-associated protein Cas2